MSAVLLTGAAGFIGSHVAEALLARGEQVIGLDSFDAFYARPLKERNLARLREHAEFTLVEGDIRDADGISSLFRQFQPDRVIHLAAKAGVRPSLQDPASYVETNINGTLHLLKAAEQYPVKHFVFASSSSVYGNASKVPFREDDRTDEPASPYAATKKAGELLTYTYHQLTGIPITCLRFFTVFGPRQRPDLAINKFVRLIEAGETVPFFGDGTTSRDYTYIADTVRGILGALDHPNGYDIYNLGRCDPVTLTEMVATIERVLGKKANLQRLPDQPGDVRTTYADASKAKSAFGYEAQVSFEDGIRSFVEWWREQPR